MSGTVVLLEYPHNYCRVFGYRSVRIDERFHILDPFYGGKQGVRDYRAIHLLALEEDPDSTDKAPKLLSKRRLFVCLFLFSSLVVLAGILYPEQVIWNKLGFCCEVAFLRMLETGGKEKAPPPTWHASLQNAAAGGALGANHPYEPHGSRPYCIALNKPLPTIPPILPV